MAFNYTIMNKYLSRFASSRSWICQNPLFVVHFGHLLLGLSRVCSAVLCEFENAALLWVLGVPLVVFYTSSLLCAWLLLNLVRWVGMVCPVAVWVSDTSAMVCFPSAVGSTGRRISNYVLVFLTLIGNLVIHLSPSLNRWHSFVLGSKCRYSSFLASICGSPSLASDLVRSFVFAVSQDLGWNVWFRLSLQILR